MNRRFDGFRNTPFLWEAALEGLKMFRAGKYTLAGYPQFDAIPHIRLGKLAEQFVLYELEEDESVQILKSNIQVFSKRRTIGELDCLLKQSKANIHLEIVYKYYLYDPSISTELNRWIGPNRNDSLVLKLRKLREKQLPLLYRPETGPLLDELKIKPNEFEQQVYFKAQLFLPLRPLEPSYKFVNKECIVGFYMREEDLSLFTNHSFYIPPKLDWLVEPSQDVEWVSAPAFQAEVAVMLGSHRSPLCWMQSPEGEVQKFFIVWWE